MNLKEICDLQKLPDNPMVSVNIITYNHSAFIEDTLEKVISQQTNFPFELIVGDDFSTDNTRDILVDYQNKYPHIIKLLLNNENLGVKTNGINVIKASKGKYIAMCEGDDYWTDPLKLQKQVNFLEANPDYAVCYHNADIINEEGKLVSHSKLPEKMQKDFSSFELKTRSWVLTLTMCFRNVIKSFPDEFFKVTNGDTFLTSMLGQHGKGKYLPDIQNAVYRKHSQSIWSSRQEIYRDFSSLETSAWLYRYYKRIDDQETTDFYKETVTAWFVDFIRKWCDPENENFVSIFLKILTENDDIIVNKDFLINIRNLIKKNYIKKAIDDFNNKDYSKAIDGFSLLLKLDDKDAALYNNQGVAYYKVEAYDKAVACFQKALALKADYGDALFNLGLIYEKKKQSTEAVDCFHQCYLLKYKHDEALKHVKLNLLNKIKEQNYFKVKLIAFSDVEADGEKRKLWGDYWLKKEIEEAFRNKGHSIVEHNPDIIFHLFGAPVKNLPVNTWNVIWIHSHPDWITPAILEQYDQVYCISRNFIDNIRLWGFDANLLVGSTSKKPKHSHANQYDIVFVGNTRGEIPRKIVMDLGDDLLNSDKKIKIWGNGWEPILPEKCYGGTFRFPDLEKLYATSKISLNDHHDDMRINGFINQRILDIYASGGFVISDQNQGINQVFGSFVPQYTNRDHLQKMIDYYLSNESERKQVIQKGKKIAEQYSHHYVCKNIVDGVKNHSFSIINDRKKILYIDYFLAKNSNFYWLEAFSKQTGVKAFDIRDNLNALKIVIDAVKPCHIHLGGSIKNHIVPIDLLNYAKEKYNTTISSFYGDAFYSDYHFELSKVIDTLYLSNYTHIQINEDKGVKNNKYLICPTTEKFNLNHNYIEKEFDLLFVGNNNNPSRLEILYMINDTCPLLVSGEGWENTKLNYHIPVYGDDFAMLCKKAKIVLGLTGNEWINLKGYFSNRLVNTLATGTFLIYRYTEDAEDIFQHKKHLVWYKDTDELMEYIQYYLKNSDEREKIASEGQKVVLSKYTYDHHVKEILTDHRFEKAKSV